MNGLQIFADPEAAFTTLPERFRVRIKRLEPLATACWLWDGCCSYQGCQDREDPDAYGRVWYRAPDDDKGRNWLAHRATYTIIIGPIGANALGEPLVLDHRVDRCSSRRCVRPDHLEPITFLENTLRGFSFRNGRPAFYDEHPALFGGGA